MENVYLVRHAESIPNSLGIIISSLDQGIQPQYGLTELGRLQSRQAGKLIWTIASNSSYESIRIISSPFSRTIETAQGILAELDHATLHSINKIKVYPLQLDDRLRERFFGDFDHQPSSNYENVWREDSANDQDGMNEKRQVEHVDQVAKRAFQVVAENLPAAPKREMLVLISHGDALQILRACINKMEPLKHRSLPHLANACVTKAVLDNHCN